jgi:hypothetical protein
MTAKKEKEMESKQRSNEPVSVITVREERAAERPERRLKLVALEERVAPNAIWGE